MSKRKERDSAASPAIYLVAAIVAAIAGFGTVYVSFAPSDNGEAELSGPGASGEGTASGPLAGLNKGPMAPLLLRPKPLDLPEIAFAEGDGKPKSLADFAGKVVLLNIWATWCVPCREEMPALNALAKEMGSDKFQVVPVNIDSGDDDKPKTFLAETGVDALQLYRDKTIAVFNSLKKEGLAMGLPVTLLIDDKGCLISAMNGPAAWDSEDAKTLIKGAIGS